jgi:hypothetical protein
LEIKSNKETYILLRISLSTLSILQACHHNWTHTAGGTSCHLAAGRLKFMINRDAPGELKWETITIGEGGGGGCEAKKYVNCLILMWGNIKF